MTSLAVERPRISLFSLLRSGDEHSSQLVGSLSTRLHRRATRSPEGADHLHLTIATFGHSGRCTRQYRTCRCLGVDGVGLASAVLVTASGANYLEDLYPLSPQEAGKSGAKGARALHPGTL
jgi:hypothetical protein